LIGKLQPGYGKYKVSKIPFMQMENIARFLEGAQKAGVPQHDLFQTVDLFEDKNRMQVVDAIWSLSRHAYKNGAANTVSLLCCRWKPMQKRKKKEYVIFTYSGVLVPGSQACR
jgi:Calponin homology (CH) domain